MTRWILISDLQFGHRSAQVRDNSDRARRLIDQVVREAPDFVINAGDHINGEVKAGDAERRNVRRLWTEYHRAMHPLTECRPVISAIGNHDQTGQAASPKEFCRQTRRAGKLPYYSVTIGSVHVIVLDIVARRHQGGFLAGTPQAKWLARDLKRPRQAACTIAVGHYPIFMRPRHAGGNDPSLYYNELTKETGVLLPMLLDAGVDLYLCGHHHVYERSRYQGLTQVMAGAADLAFDGLLDPPANKYCRALDERQGYVRFTLTDKTIRAETVALSGEAIDAWAQRLNRDR